jgi:CubicO group peptidase (beta-lactamase class C family)
VSPSKYARFWAVRHFSPDLEALQGFSDERPVFAPFSTPVYSNFAFQILSYAIEGITNKTVASIIEQRIFKALNMTSSSYTVPLDTSNGVIPGDVNTSSWDFDGGDEIPYVRFSSTRLG